MLASKPTDPNTVKKLNSIIKNITSLIAKKNALKIGSITPAKKEKFKINAGPMTMTYLKRYLMISLKNRAAHVQFVDIKIGMDRLHVSITIMLTVKFAVYFAIHAIEPLD